MFIILQSATGFARCTLTILNTFCGYWVVLTHAIHHPPLIYIHVMMFPVVSYSSPIYYTCTQSQAFSFSTVHSLLYKIVWMMLLWYGVVTTCSSAQYNIVVFCTHKHSWMSSLTSWMNICVRYSKVVSSWLCYNTAECYIICSLDTHSFKHILRILGCPNARHSSSPVYM